MKKICTRLNRCYLKNNFIPLNASKAYRHSMTLLVNWIINLYGLIFRGIISKLFCSQNPTANFEIGTVLDADQSYTYQVL